MPAPASLSALFEQLDLAPAKDPALYQQALTHRSAQGLAHYERLEFFGDAVLKLLVSQWLYNLPAPLREGEMTKVRAGAVSDETLARVAAGMGLGAYLVLGAAEKHTAGQSKTGILASALEALLGAIYLDQGAQSANQFLKKWLGPEFEAALLIGGQDNYKAVLQEYTQGRFKALPSYRLQAEVGPEHDRTYAIDVLVEGVLRGSGQGASKKHAEQAAARQALEALQREDPL